MAGVFIKEAPHYYAAGVNVLPIAAGEKAPPRGVLWGQWQHRRQTSDELTQLLDAYPKTDVGIILGGPGGLVDVETDGPEGQHSLHGLGLPLPPTAMFDSPRGVHRIYRCAQLLNTRKSLGPKLDVLAARSYVVVPTSAGRNWITRGHLANVTLLPKAWEEMLQANPEQSGAPTLAEVEDRGVPEGRRNITLAALVGRWITQGYSATALRGKALQWARHCVPPLQEKEVLAVVESILRARQRTRSPEREALLTARDCRLGLTARIGFVALVTLYGELGRVDQQLSAPVRLIANLTGASPATVCNVYEELERAGLIELGKTRDPSSGRWVTTVRFRATPAAGGQSFAYRSTSGERNAKN